MTSGPNQQRATGILQLAGLTNWRLNPEREAVGARHFQLRNRAGRPEDTDVGQRALRPDNGHALWAANCRLAQRFKRRQAVAFAEQRLDVLLREMDVAVGDPHRDRRRRCAQAGGDFSRTRVSIMTSSLSSAPDVYLPFRSGRQGTIGSGRG